MRCWNMPQYLKSDAITLLDSSIEMYKLSLFGLGIPRVSRTKRNAANQYAPVVGLLGTSMELLIKAFIVQGLGSEKIYINKSRKTFEKTVELIKLLENDIKMDVEWINLLLHTPTNKESRKDMLLGYLAKIRLLQDMRSESLHGGKGCSRDIAVSIANDIYQVFNFFAKNKRFKAYLRNIPKPEELVKDREIIIEDLKNHINMARSVDEKLDYVQNLFLVLPYIPDNAPDWVEEFEKIRIASPKDNAVSFLVRTLENAHNISLLKSRGGKTGIPVRIDKDNINAVPISIESLKKRLSNPTDIFNNKVVAANTRIENEQLDLPCAEHLIELFDTGIDEIRIEKQALLTAEQSWPFIAAAMSFPGTPLPCFQFIKYCDELPKLYSFIEKIKKFSRGYLIKRIDVLLEFISSRIKNEEMHWNRIPNNKINRIFIELKGFAEQYGKCDSYIFPSGFIKNISVNEQVLGILREVLEGKLSAGNAIRSIIDTGNLDKDEKSVIGKLLENCNDFDNRHAFKAILDNNDLSTLHTQARKKMLFIDFYYNFGD